MTADNFPPLFLNGARREGEKHRLFELWVRLTHLPLLFLWCDVTKAVVSIVGYGRREGERVRGHPPPLFQGGRGGDGNMLLRPLSLPRLPSKSVGAVAEKKEEEEVAAGGPHSPGGAALVLL